MSFLKYFSRLSHGNHATKYLADRDLPFSISSSSAASCSAFLCASAASDGENACSIANPKRIDRDLRGKLSSLAIDGSMSPGDLQSSNLSQQMRTKPKAPISRGSNSDGRCSSLSFGPPRTAVTWLKFNVNSTSNAEKMSQMRLAHCKNLKIFSSLGDVSFDCLSLRKPDVLLFVFESSGKSEP
jgi:hypothetical protein